MSKKAQPLKLKLTKNQKLAANAEAVVEAAAVVVAMNKKKKSLRMIRQTTMANPMTTLSNSKSKTSTLRLSTKRKLPIAAAPVVAAADVRKLLATILLLKRKNAQNDLARARVRNLAMTLMMK